MTLLDHSILPTLPSTPELSINTVIYAVQQEEMLRRDLTEEAGTPITNDGALRGVGTRAAGGVNKSICSEGDTVKFRKMKDENKKYLTQWMHQHKKHPYPTKEEKILLGEICSLRPSQIETWFGNRRREIKKSSMEEWLKKHPRYSLGKE